MIVFVSMRSSDSPTYFERRDAISHDWSRFFSEKGIVPILVPNALENPERLFEELPGVGLLLTGGDDIGAGERDRTEKQLLEVAVERGLPVFGACRGLQMINVFFGGGISQPGQSGHVAADHDVQIEDSLGSALPIGTFTVNSYHDDCVRVDDLAEELTAFAVAEGGVVEGLHHPHLPVTAIQWHPERANPGAALDEALFRRWFGQCA